MALASLPSSHLMTWLVSTVWSLLLVPTHGAAIFLSPRFGSDHFVVDPHSSTIQLILLFVLTTALHDHGSLLSDDDFDAYSFYVLMRDKIEVLST